MSINLKKTNFVTSIENYNDEMSSDAIILSAKALIIGACSLGICSLGPDVLDGIMKLFDNSDITYKSNFILGLKSIGLSFSLFYLAVEIESAIHSMDIPPEINDKPKKYELKK